VIYFLASRSKEAFMRQAKLAEHLKEEDIKAKMRASKVRDQFQRWQAIYLTMKGLRAEIVAEYLGTTQGTVHQWIYQYNHYGPESFILQGRGGRRFGFLKLEEEKALLEDMRTNAEHGKIITAFAIREHIEKRVGKSVSKDYLYDLLHRHGWRKIMPRPRHPKANKERQEEFKKNFGNWWQPPKKVSPGRIKDH
jgi:transposase